MKSITLLKPAQLLIAMVLAVGLLGIAPSAAQIDEPAFSASVVASRPQARGWAGGFQVPGLNGPVSALAVGPDGSLYAGGNFTAADGAETVRVARWDGTAWHPLGSGMNNNGIEALAVAQDGTVYAGGNFTTAGGVTANYIARWNGTAWHPLGDGMGGATHPYVHALAVGLDGSLYAGGAFTTAGGVAANYIARWDGSAWHPLGDGMGGNEYPPVFALAVGLDGSLYAGGWFTTAGDVQANYIARWDGAAWHELGSGMTRREFTYINPVDALAVDRDGTLYAGGTFTAAGGVAAENIAKWDGVTWSTLGAGVIQETPHNAIQSLVVGPDSTLYAAGSFTTAGGIAANRIARWDGTAWHALGSGLREGFYGDVQALTLGSDGALYAGGSFLIAGDTAAKYIARWEPPTSSWHLLGSGNGMVGAPVQALAVGHVGSLYAGGFFSSAGSAPANNIARWDGTAWHSLGSGVGGCGPYSCVAALTIGPDGSLYAGGDFTSTGGVEANAIARWDGATWHSLGSGMGGCGPYSCVAALTTGPDGSLYAGGDFTSAGSLEANAIARWDGATWHALGSGMNGAVSALAVDKLGNVYAGGSFTSAGGVPANSIARWDGTAWYPLGDGMNRWASVCALAVGSDGSLYAGGDFNTAGGVPASKIARWDGTVWHALVGELNGLINSLVFGSDGSLFVGGNFSPVHGRGPDRIARWDGAWHPLGAGVDNDVSALAATPDGLLYAGGYFAMAGRVQSSRIALWLGEYETHLPLVVR